MKILAFGEILWDIIEGVEHLGGAPFNFAAHAAQCGNESFIISRLGEDSLGMQAHNLSKTFGVDGSLIQRDEIHPTGIVDVTLLDGQPDYFIRNNSAYDYITYNDALKGLKKTKFDVFYFGSLAQRNDTSAETLYTILSENKFKHVFYDVNLRKAGYTENIIKKSLAAATIFKLNVDELPVISKILVGMVLTHEEFCKCIKSLYQNLNTIIITASERGCFVYENELMHAPGTPVTVKDAVGAGDAFSATFMHLYATSGDAPTSVKIANQVGAFVATKTGAIPKYSTHIMNLLNINSEKYSINATRL
ncbi:MAG TPA: PfkB family carbohydrate kinase [Cyclobacteriaceae bacterium]